MAGDGRRPRQYLAIAPAGGELGGHLRTGLEDTFYLPDGTKVGFNGTLVEMLARYAREAGRTVADPAEARSLMGLAAI